ncbi:MAG: hypothetical protein ACC726_02540 [Chloroflexota bacterium]
MRRTSAMLAVAALVLLSGCVQAAPSTQAPGAVVDAPPRSGSALYSPVSRSALAFGLPDLVQGIRLTSSPSSVTRADEDDFARNLAIRPILVGRGIGPAAVSIEQKGDTYLEIPSVAMSAVQVRGVPADLLTVLDPSFYLMLTSVTREQWKWIGDKPGPEQVTIGDREVWSTKWVGFRVAWYAWGDVLYVVLAQNDQLLAAALRQMPWPSETT